MHVYMFTYHGHGTWMPDHRHGFVRRGQGVQAPDRSLAKLYRDKQRLPAVVFTPPMQDTVARTLSDAGRFIDATVHGVSVDPTHVHVLVSWKHDRVWKSMRRSLRTAASKALNAAHGRRDWFADQPSRKCVRSAEHFDYLLLEYLPKHGGVVWRRAISVDKAQQRDGASPISVIEQFRRRRSQ